LIQHEAPYADHDDDQQREEAVRETRVPLRGLDQTHNT
jgi:hypothetical protein